MTVFEMAKKYYPKYWKKERLEALLKAKKITEEEFNKLVEGENNDSNQNQTEFTA